MYNFHLPLYTDSVACASLYIGTRRNSEGLTSTIKPICLRLLFVLLVAAVQASPQSATEKVLHNFGRYEGAEPNTGVIRDSAGNLYGTAFQGGADYGGVLFEVDATGSYKVLHVFNRESGGWS